MYGRKDALLGAAKLITELEKVAYENNGASTVTGIHSRPWGACNIQSSTKVVFTLMHWEAQGLGQMGADIEKRIKSIASLHGLEPSVTRDVHLLPGDFWPEAIDCVKRACGDEGIAARTGTGHDSTMTTTLVPTAMVFARAKDGISHSPKEWTDKDDCMKSALVLGRSVLNFDEYLRNKSV
jgi:N-carbamoyl-L-amino-acid hydrolase